MITNKSKKIIFFLCIVTLAVSIIANAVCNELQIELHNNLLSFILLLMIFLPIEIILALYRNSYPPEQKVKRIIPTFLMVLIFAAFVIPTVVKLFS